MTDPTPVDLAGKTALVTGAARRIGAAIVRTLHEAGMRVAVHYRGSADEAVALCVELNDSRPDSAKVFQADLIETGEPERLIDEVLSWAGSLDLLVNNASTFYPTPLGSIDDDSWTDLVGSNLKAPLFLSQAAAPALRDASGCIVNMVDIHGQRPLRNHAVYCAAKAGLIMLTRSLARELAPELRVNGIAPGPVLWPKGGMDEELRQEIIGKTALKRPGSPRDVARTALFLASDAPYVTGQVIAVDGGRSI